MPDCNTPYNNACRKDTPYPSVSAESVPSLIDNLVYALYGTITKSVINRRVVWNIPCDPNNTATINNIPRNEGEGLLCYIIRVLNLTTPSGFVTVNGVQTLTNKTLTATVINTATINNLTATGTLALPVGSVTTPQLADSSVTNAKITDVSISKVTASASTFQRLGNAVASGRINTTGDTNGKGGFLVGGGVSTQPSGIWLATDGASNWLVAQTSKAENPTELIVYGSSAQGYATSVAGTNQITKTTGTDFRASWVGNTIYFLRKKFKVSSVTSATSLTVTEVGGQAVTFPSSITEAFNYCYTSGSGLCSISGTTVTFTSGDPFTPLFYTDFKFTIDGVTVPTGNITFVNPYTLTISPALGDKVGAVFSWMGNINDQLASLRVQAIQGSNEENVNLLAIAGDNFLGRYYTLNTGTAGAGSYRPIFIGSGGYTDNSYQHQMGVYPRNHNGSSNQGYVALGGVQGREGLRVYSPNSSTPLANFITTEGASATFGPSFRAQGSDSNIAFGIDTKGNGEFRVTQDFSRTVFKAQGTGSSVNWLKIVASASGAATQLSVDSTSADANVDIAITPKGTGAVSTSGAAITNCPTTAKAWGAITSLVNTNGASQEIVGNNTASIVRGATAGLYTLTLTAGTFSNPPCVTPSGAANNAGVRVTAYSGNTCTIQCYVGATATDMAISFTYLGNS